MIASAWFRCFLPGPPSLRLKVGVLLAAMLVGGFGVSGQAQTVLATPAPTPRPGGFFLFRSPQRSIQQVIPSQPGPVVNKAVYETANPDNTHVIVSLSRQRVFLYNEEQVAIDSPISSGKKGHTTPQGHFHVLEKDPNHSSNIYGAFCDRSNRIVRSGVSSVIDSAPSGTHFIGAPMKWFMRLTPQGVGMHVGILPGYAASHGCVRLPPDIAPLIYQKVRVGTPVTVEE